MRCEKVRTRENKRECYCVHMTCTYSVYPVTMCTHTPATRGYLCIYRPGGIYVDLPTCKTTTMVQKVYIHLTTMKKFKKYMNVVQCTTPGKNKNWVSRFTVYTVTTYYSTHARTRLKLSTPTHTCSVPTIQIYVIKFKIPEGTVHMDHLYLYKL